MNKAEFLEIIKFASQYVVVKSGNQVAYFCEKIKKNSDCFDRNMTSQIINELQEMRRTKDLYNKGFLEETIDWLDQNTDLPDECSDCFDFDGIAILHWIINPKTSDKFLSVIEKRIKSIPYEDKKILMKEIAEIDAITETISFFDPAVMKRVKKIKNIYK